jgi:hypothetical protein
MTFFSATSVDYADDCNAEAAPRSPRAASAAPSPSGGGGRGGTDAATFTSNSEVGNVTATVHIGSKRI